jgi:hypothetical protein
MVNSLFYLNKWIIYVKTTGITWTSNLKIENGHVESKTLPQHLRNIPKSNFPILSVI